MTKWTKIKSKNNRLRCIRNARGCPIEVQNKRLVTAETVMRSTFRQTTYQCSVRTDLDFTLAAVTSVKLAPRMGNLLTF
jgi:hypothetical protein